MQPKDIQLKRSVLPATAIAFAALSAILSWVGFQGIYGEPEGSAQMPGTFTQIWPVAAQLVLSCAMVLLVGWSFQGAALSTRATGWLAEHYKTGLRVLLVLVALGLALGVIALRAFPNSGDEYDYLFQAATFRAGRLWNALPPLEHVFTFNHIAEKDGKWVSLFFPGWPLILAGFTSLHIPAVVASPVMALLLLVVFSRLTCLVSGPAAALLGAALLSCCPFFLLNGASYFSHIPTALFAVLFVLCGIRFIKTASGVWALSAGAALGAVGLIRPYTVFPLLIPFAAAFLLRSDRRHYSRLPLLLLAGLPFLAALLLYNNAITGSPWLNVEAWTVPNLHIGLHPIDEDGSIRPLTETSFMTLVRLMRLAQWTSPVLCLLYGLALIWKLYRRRIAFYDFVFPLLVFSYIFFPNSGGNQYGPRYFFDAYPFLVLTVASAAAAWFPGERSNRRKAAVAAAFAGALLTGLGSYPALAWQFHRMVNERMEPYDLVAQARLSNALVVIGARTGSAFPIWMDSTDLTRNGIDFSGSVIYANEIPGGNCALARTFPDREVYRYGVNNHHYPGRLVPISPCPDGAKSKSAEQPGQ